MSLQNEVRRGYWIELRESLWYWGVKGIDDGGECAFSREMAEQDIDRHHAKYFAPPKHNVTNADVKAWLEARIAELSIVGRPLTERELFRRDGFSQARDAIIGDELDALGGDL